MLCFELLTQQKMRVSACAIMVAVRAPRWGWRGNGTGIFQYNWYELVLDPSVRVLGTYLILGLCSSRSTESVTSNKSLTKRNDGGS